MSNKLILDFDKIRETTAVLPEIAVADFILLRGEGQGKRPDSKSVTGIILELNNPQALHQGIQLPAGPGILYIRLPSGETLAERVHVEASRGKNTGNLSLELAKPEEVFGYSSRLTHADAAHQSPGLVDLVRAQRTPSDRSRWSTVTLDQAKRPRNKPPQLSTLLKPFASQVVTERQGMLGIAKLKSSVGTFDPMVSNRARSAHFGSSLVGQVRTVKPTKLYGPNDGPRAKWNAPLSEKTQKDRIFALSFDASGEPTPLQVACIPAIWRRQSDKPAPMTVRYVSEQLTGDQRGARVVVEVEDPKFRALLQFMQTGDLASSVSLLAQAERALFDKFYNPYAAAAGGYVLTFTGYVDWNKNWGRWLHNLATHFSDLPDGHVLLANLILQGPTPAKEQIPGYSNDNASELALKSVLEAVRRGPPMYRFGLRMLSSNVAILNHLVPADHADRAQLDAAADYVRNLNMRVDRDQPFCVFNVADNAP
jgi:hypothetical protein